MAVIETPFLFSEWQRVSPDPLDLSSRAGDDDRAARLAAAWAESFGEAPRAQPAELSTTTNPAKALAEQWAKENA